MRDLLSVSFTTGFCAAGALLAFSFCAAGAAGSAGSAAARGRQSTQVNQALNVNSRSSLQASESSPQDDSSARSDATSFAGRRDPFKLPVITDDAEGGVVIPAHRPPGVRGLLVSELSLEGVVSESSGHDMIAVVTNNTGRAYFLHENEQLFDGRLTKITPAAAYFVETLRDRKGHESVQQVVKWLNSKPGDAQ